MRRLVKFSTQSSSSRLLSNLLLLVGRGSVYLSGFVYNLLFSYLLLPQDFGVFAAIMASAELFLVPVTLGASLLVYRNARRDEKLPLAEIMVILGCGTALAALVLVLLLPIQRLQAEGLLFALAIAIPLGASQLLVSAFRGFGYITLFTLDPAIRYFSYVLASLLSFWLVGASLPALVGAIVLSNAGIFSVYFYCSIARGRISRSIDIKLKEQLWLVFSGLVSFAVRKSDILILSIGVSSAELGSLKIAFLLAEAPMQFVQAVMYKYSKSFEFSGHTVDAIRRRSAAVGLAILGVALSVGALCAAMLFQLYFAGKYEFIYALPFLLIYYLTKIVSLPLDQALIMEGHVGLLSLVYGVSAGIKVAVLSVGVQVAGTSAVFAYPLLGIIDLFVVEVLARRHLKLSFFKWLSQ